MATRNEHLASVTEALDTMAADMTQLMATYRRGVGDDVVHGMLIAARRAIMAAQLCADDQALDALPCDGDLEPLPVGEDEPVFGG